MRLPGSCLDVSAAVLIFVVIGRASHSRARPSPGSRRHPAFCAGSGPWARPCLAAALAIAPSGIAVWLCTVRSAMILRVVSGQGTAVAFTSSPWPSSLFLLGWRLLARVVAR